jgi:NDP-sugar pyrophosphorylase family protein
MLIVVALHSDVICEFPLADMLDFHKKHGGEGTIMVLCLCPIAAKAFCNSCFAGD